MNSSISTANSASSGLPLLFRLIEANNWEMITKMFLSHAKSKQRFQHLSALVSKSKLFNGMTILHAVVRFDPPAELISRMLELCPRDASSRDCMNRTPLHVAAGCKASAAVTKVLAGCYPEACMIRDKDGRTPLHMACDSSCELFEDRKEKEQHPPSYRTVAVLLSSELDAVVLEDNDGTSAIEYALCSDADLKTVRLLQRAAQRVNKREEAEKKAQLVSILKASQRSPTLPSKGFAPRGLLTAPLA